MFPNITALATGLGILSVWSAAIVYWHLLQARQRRRRQRQWNEFAHAHRAIDLQLDRTSRRRG
jgi:hypothetical protein